MHHAIDWLMSRVKPGGNLGINVGQNTFDDLDYADDGALLTSARTTPLPPAYSLLLGDFSIMS